MSNNQGAFAELLRSYRRAARLTQEELAERAGISPRGVQDLERGLRRQPHFNTVGRLATALGLQHSERTTLMDAAFSTSVAVPDSHPERFDLPVAASSFIGREQEIAWAVSLLRTTRLLTLTGAGGVGKTRLAIEVARRVAGHYADGVRLVDLAPLSDPSLVPEAVARAVGAREQPGRPVQQTLVQVLRSQQLLLVLDNCEHLLRTCAELADGLLRGCEHLHVLATSREVFRVAGESAWRVPSLQLPPVVSGTDSWAGHPMRPRREEVARSEAGQLFVARAAAALPDFALSDDNALTVARVCHQLDGLPLAIELAAARVSALSVEQLATRLADRFRLLTNGNRTALPRHRTLAATVEWSYALLTEAERKLFERLSVFAGGWSLPAAEAVCTGDGIESADVLELLAQLVDKSLVVAQPGSGGEVRYRQLETLREYARARLANSGSADTTRRQHAMFFLALTQRAKPELTGTQPGVWLRRVEQEHDNVRAALRWTIDCRDVELGLQLAGAVWRFWYVRDHEGEGRRWLEELLELDDTVGGARAETRADALAGAAALARDQGDYDRAEALCEASLSLFRAQGNWQGVAWALQHLGCTARDRGAYRRATSVLEECLALFREVGDQRGMGWSLHNLARVAREQGDCNRATALAEQSLCLFRDRADERGVAYVLHHLGCIARDQGDDDRAATLSEQSLAMCRKLGDNGGSAWALNHLGRIAASRGDYGRAMALLKEGLELARDRGDKREIVAFIEEFAILACADAQHEHAARLVAAASRLREATCAALPPVDVARYEAAVAAARTHLGDRLFASLWAEGHALVADESVAEALRMSLTIGVG